jgi:hypothetical protein
MKSISIEELITQGYSEDSKSLKEFEKPYRIPSIVGLSGFIICFTLVVLGKLHGKVGLISIGISLLFCLATIVRGYMSRPKSKLTGKPLIKYKNRFPAPDVGLELIYVCPDGKTFFRRIYAFTGYNSGGGVSGC